MPDNKLSSYRVTDLPQLTDLSGQDLFLITHQKSGGGWESQSIPFRRLTAAVKRRGFREELSVLNGLAVSAAMKGDVQAEAQTRLTQDLSVANAAKDYTDAEIAKVHTHANYGILSSITDMRVSQWENDAGYLTEAGGLSSYATKADLSDAVSALSAADAETLASAKAYTDEEIAGLHTHDNLAVLSSITGKKVSQWENDAGYVTEKSLAGYALKKEIPTYVSQLENDAGYITSDGIPTKLSQFENDAGYQLKTVFRDWTEA